MRNKILTTIDHIIPIMRIVWASQVALNIMVIIAAIILYHHTQMETTPWVMGIAGAAMAVGNCITFAASIVYRKVIHL